jgi:hypothetical protein
MEKNLDRLINEYGLEAISKEIVKRCKQRIHETKFIINEINESQNITEINVKTSNVTTSNITTSNMTNANDQPKKEYPIKTPEQIKKERLDHRAAVEKKRAELEAQGIVPESLVTKENLEKWLGSGLSYQRIAKELTGCQDAYISTIAIAPWAKRFTRSAGSAKSYGLKSVIAGIIAGKYRERK